MSVGCSFWFQGQSGSGEAAFDEAGPVLDLLQAVPDDLDQVSEAGDGKVGQHAAFEHRPDPLHRIQVRRISGHWAIHLSGPDEKRPLDAVVMAAWRTKVL